MSYMFVHPFFKIHFSSVCISAFFLYLSFQAVSTILYENVQPFQDNPDMKYLNIIFKSSFLKYLTFSALFLSNRK